MKQKHFSRALLMGMSLCLTQAIHANKGNDLSGGGSPGSIIAGTATFEVTGFDGGLDWRTGIIVTDGSCTTSRLWASGWAYRLSTDTQELTLGATPDTSNYTGNVASFTWDNVNGQDKFNAALTIELTQPQAGGAVITRTLSIENIDTAPITIDIFNYEDYDMNCTFGGDSAALTNDPDHITIMDGVDTGEYRAGGNTNYQVTGFQDLLLALEDVAITDLDNTGLPFGSGDFTGGFQWSMVEVPRFGTYTVQTVNSFGMLAPTPADPVLFDDIIWKDGFETVAPPPAP